MASIAPGWELDVERRGNWLLVRPRISLEQTAEPPPLAEEVWKLLEQHGLCQVIVELDQIDVLRSHVIGQLLRLQKRICTVSGAIRLCGLSPRNLEAIRLCRLDQHLPCFNTREDALQS